jgi:hypothetical protein
MIPNGIQQHMRSQVPPIRYQIGALRHLPSCGVA